MKTGNASELELIDQYKSKWGTQIESKLHRFFQDKKISGEWFKLSWFQKSEVYKKFN